MKPSESIEQWVARNYRCGDQLNDLQYRAILYYLDEEHAKKEEEKPPRLGMFDLRSPEEWEAQIKREAIKEFAEKLRKEWRKRGMSDLVLLQTLKDYYQIELN